MGRDIVIPIGSMYGIFPYIWLKFMVNVGKYTIHGSLGIIMVDITYSRVMSRDNWVYPVHVRVPMVFKQRSVGILGDKIKT